jgi:subtilisin-like proprotein convertase family protein
LLESKPSLGWRDVQEILIRSARKVDEGSPGWSTNGAGYHFHHTYGAGMIDAAAAVGLGGSWKNLGERVSREAALSGMNAAIPDGSSAGVSCSLDLAGEEFRVEHVLCTIDIEHAYRGDLVITLTSPSGTVSQFSEVHDDENEDYENYTFLSVRHWGEMASGRWTVKVSDGEAGDAGVLRSASLKVFGTAMASGYDAWVANTFPENEQGQPSVVAENADPDRDGRQNLMEYAFDANPKVPEGRLPTELLLVPGTSVPTVRFVADTAKRDLTYRLMHSTDLIKWSLLTPTVFATNGALETREATVMPVPEKVRQSYVQLEVSRTN